jgi:hypothetical protein
MPDGPAQSVINVLKKEQEQYSTAKSVQEENNVTIPTTISSTTATQSSETGEWVIQQIDKDPPITSNNPEQEAFAEVKSKPESFRQFCKIIDDKILSFNAQINAKKQQIVTLSIEATAGNCWPGIAVSVTTSGGTTPSTPTVTQDYSTITVFKEDRDLLSIYTNIDGPSPNYDAVNPFNPDSSIGLTTAYSGYGRANTKDDNGGTTLGNARLDISATLSDHNARTISAAAPFRYYAGAGVAPYASNTIVTAARCVGLNGLISQLQSEITSLRAQRDALRADLNTIKAEKATKDLQAWGINNHQRKIASQSSSKSSIITAITNLSP